VPIDNKHPLVVGYTGRNGGWPDEETYEEWAVYFAAADIAIRLPQDYIGIDSDLYKPDPDGRRAAFLALLAAPPAPRSSARDDGSGISIYRVPAGLEFPANPAPGVEIIQFHHRTAVVWPSRHSKLGRTYRWRSADDVVAEAGMVPRRDEVAELPAASLDVLGRASSSWRAGSARQRQGHQEAVVPSWWGPTQVAARAKLIVRKAERSLEAGGCRHDAVCSAAAALAWLGTATGYEIVNLALDELGQMFVDAITTGPNARASKAQAEREWNDLVTSGWALAASSHEAERSDGRR
jgi:hypothetical protein